MKIALGTVQFGMQYGVANSGERVSVDEAQRILAFARSNGIDTLDTAAAYGESEKVLGRIGVGGFKVVSKLPPREYHDNRAAACVIACVENTLANLGESSLYGFLLHRPLELLDRDGEEIYKALESLKKQGLIKKIGVSVYGPEDLEKLVPYYDFDLIQAPMNLLDRRMIESGWLHRLKQAGTEIHIRSAFMQGLLLMPAKNRPTYFDRWAGLFEALDAWRCSEHLIPLQACLGFLNEQLDVDKIVVGVDSAEQLQGIVDAASSVVSSVPEALSSSDESLINPASWKL